MKKKKRADICADFVSKYCNLVPVSNFTMNIFMYIQLDLVLQKSKFFFNLERNAWITFLDHFLLSLRYTYETQC